MNNDDVRYELRVSQENVACAVGNLMMNRIRPVYSTSNLLCALEREFSRESDKVSRSVATSNSTVSRRH